MPQSYMLTINTDLVEQAGSSFAQYFTRHISNTHDIQILIEDLAKTNIITVCKEFETPPEASPAVNTPAYYKPVYTYYLWNAYCDKWMIWSTQENKWIWIQKNYI